MLNRHQTNVLLFSMLILALFASIPAPVAGGANLGHQIYAIPAFSRQYGTSCSTCHVDFPKLNDFGKAFKDAGFKFPKDDETFIKVPPVMLGSPAQKELWPHTIWPGTIPGLPPIGLRFNTFFQVVGRNRNNFNLQTPGDPTAPFIPRTDFQSGLFSIFMAGNFGDDIAFWVDDDISVGGSGANGGLGDGYLKFVNIGRHLKLPTDSLSLRIGQFELDLPFSPARSWNLSGWDIYDQGEYWHGEFHPGLAQCQQLVRHVECSAGGGVQRWSHLPRLSLFSGHCEPEHQRRHGGDRKQRSAGSCLYVRLQLQRHLRPSLLPL